jgi:hypothetical protein
MTDGAVSGQGARLRAAVDRLHAAQVAALAGEGTPGRGDRPERRPAAGRDAYGAERLLLGDLAETGCLLVRLGRLAPGDADAARIRRRLVTLAVGCANALAELVGLAFELDEPGEPDELAGAAGGTAADDAAGGAGSGPREEAEAAAAAARRGGGGQGAGGSNGGSPAAAAVTSMRAVTDANRLLVEQLRRLMQHVGRRESWRSAGPGELWRRLLLQVAELFPLVAAQEAGALTASEARELERLTADAANYVAFLRFHPRLPTA